MERTTYYEPGQEGGEPLSAHFAGGIVLNPDILSPVWGYGLKNLGFSFGIVSISDVAFPS
jgi:hypothetical protein